MQYTNLKKVSNCPFMRLQPVQHWIHKHTKTVLSQIILLYSRNVCRISGVLNHLRDEFEGDFIPAVTDAETMVLRAGQVLLIFVITVAAMAISFVIFVTEFFWDFRKKMKAKQTTNTQWMKQLK